MEEAKWRKRREWRKRSGEARLGIRGAENVIVRKERQRKEGVGM